MYVASLYTLCLWCSVCLNGPFCHGAHKLDIVYNIFSLNISSIDIKKNNKVNIWSLNSLVGNAIVWVVKIAELVIFCLDKQMSVYLHIHYCLVPINYGHHHRHATRKPTHSLVSLNLMYSSLVCRDNEGFQKSKEIYSYKKTMHA